MALTQEEKTLCREAAMTQKSRGQSWGSPALGLCPIGAVVVHRGETLFLHDRDGLYHQLPEPEPLCTHIDLARLSAAQRGQLDSLTTVVERATKDVWAWSGHVNWREFTDALIAQGADALPEK